MTKPPIYVLAALVLVLVGGYYFYTRSLPGFWEVNTSESSLSFTSIKNGDIEEVHTISKVFGEADFTGEFLIVIDLAAVETNIDIRNQRIKDLLFETETFPRAVLSGAFTPERYEDLLLDTQLEDTISATLKLHGVEKQVEIRVLVERLGWRRIRITSLEPVIIDAGDFNLTSGIEQLRTIAGLDMIGGTVPITFEVVFEGGVEIS